MSSERLAALKAQHTKKNTFQDGVGGSYYPFWKMDIGKSAIIRFLPDKNQDNPLSFLIKKMHHELVINGEIKKIPCLKQYDPLAECPICKASASYYRSEGKESINGKKYYRKLQYVGQALIIDDPLPPNSETGETFKNTIKFITIGTKIYEAIIDAFESGEFEEVPEDFQEGTNFIIKKTQSGDYADYSRSKFQKKSSSLDEETIALVQEAAVDLSTLLPAKPTFEEVEAAFQAALNGVSHDDDDDDDDVPYHQSPSVKPISDDTVDDEAEAILASLRANRANKK